MTVKSWKAEFLPIPAKKVAKKKAVEHSAQKWRGVLPENLERHGLSKEGRHLVGESDREKFLKWMRGEIRARPAIEGVPLNDITCALCVHYFKDNEELVTDDDEDTSAKDCPECPIVKNGHHPCGVIGSRWSLAVTPNATRREILLLIEAITGTKPE